jgi:VWFA-related protein
MRRLAATLSLCAIAAPAQQATFQSETRVVVVDAVVTSRRGDFVRDLTAKDFRVWEDNKEQPIRSFSRETDTSAEGPRRLVLVFDFTGMSAADQAAARQAAMDLVDAALAGSEPERPLLAVAEFSDSFALAQSFTGNADRLRDALRRLKFDTAAAGATPVAASARDLVLTVGNLARNLGALPGRKALVLFAGDALLAGAQSSDVSGLAPQFNRSNVAFYPIVSRIAPVDSQASGTAGFDCDQRRPAPRNGLAPKPQPCNNVTDDNGLNALADATGGFLTPPSNDLRAQLQKIAAEQNEYYLLSYSPPPSKGEGCHALRVKVDRKDITVRARSSYCPQKPQDILAQSRVEQNLEKHAAGRQSGESAASIAAPFFYSTPNVARVHVAMEIPAEVLKLGDQKSRPRAEVNLLGIASAPDGSVAARFSDIVRPDAQAGATLHYEREFRIAPGQYSLVVALSSGAANFGKVETPLSIAPWDKGQLALSAIAMGRETRPAAEIGLVASLLDQNDSLVAHDVQLIPSGSLIFGKGEQAFCYFEIYAFGTTPISMRARILDSASREVKWDGGSAGVDRPPTGADRIPVGFSVPIGSLPPGAWSLEATATDTAGGSVRRTIDFKTR